MLLSRFQFEISMRTSPNTAHEINFNLTSSRSTIHRKRLCVIHPRAISQGVPQLLHYNSLYLLIFVEGKSAPTQAMACMQLKDKPSWGWGWGWGWVGLGLGMGVGGWGVRVVVTKAPFVNFSVNKFSMLQKYLLFLTTFIIDRCHRSWAAATPVKYKRDIQ